MRTACGFLLVILLATVVANATARADKSAKHRSGPTGFVAKRGGLWIPMMGKAHHAVGHPSGADNGPMNRVPKPQDTSERKLSKLCLNMGPCHKRILVCPKKCRAAGGLEDMHAQTRCIFDCNKCIAYC